MSKKLICLLAICACIFKTQATELIIVLDADFSGGAKNGGIAIKRGVELAIDDINKQGGLLGQKLKLVTSNHRGNPARGVGNVKKHMKDEAVIAVIGGVHTPVVLAQLPFLHEMGVPFLIPWAAGTTIVDNGFTANNVFRVSLRDSEAAITILDHASRQGITNISLMLERTGWGRSNENSMSSYAATLGISIDEVLWFNWRQKSFEPLIKQIEMKPNKAIVLVANAPEGAHFVSTLHKDAYKRSLPVLSHWGISAGDFVSMVGTETLSEVSLAVLQSFHFSKTSMRSAATSLLDDYAKKYNEEVTENTISAAVGVAQGFDIVHLLAKAVSNVQSVKYPAIIRGLEQIESHEGVIKHYKFPFTDSKRDALMAEDYLMTQYDTEGNLVPFNND